MTTIKAVEGTGNPLPGAGLDFSKMPGHWLLAQMGKRVLRPGGRELTSWMLATLDITAADDVVEFAPGLGVTARAVLSKQPAHYTAIERDTRAKAQVEKYLHGSNQRVVKGSAAKTGLPDASASVLYGEALLTMQTTKTKEKIVAEAFRVLQPGGRYGMHEIAVKPADIDPAVQAAISKDLQQAIRVGARPLLVSQWREMLEGAGFAVRGVHTVPMALLELRRLVADEGLTGVARITWNVAKSPAARRRILKMWRTFRRHRANLCAISFVVVKPLEAG